MVAAPPPSTRFVPDWLRTASGARIAVVGADGFIGNQVVRFALAAGAGVVAVHLKDPWRLADVDDSRLERHGVDRMRLAEAGVLPALDDTDAVIWLAYVPPPPGDALRHERRLNAAAATRARELGPPVVFASSADVYGARPAVPATEEHEPAPIHAYGIAKLEAEQMLHESGPILRVATVFGTGENGPRAIPSFIRALDAGETLAVDGDGSDVRDYVHVGDVAAAFVNAALAPRPGVYNVGSGVGRSTLEIADTVADALGVEARVEHRPSPRPSSCLILSVDRARAAFGFEPALDLVPPIREEAAWLTKVVAR